jgi:hypothetical protein
MISATRRTLRLSFTRRSNGGAKDTRMRFVARRSNSALVTDAGERRFRAFFSAAQRGR